MPSARRDDVNLPYFDNFSWWSKVDIKDVSECWPWTQSTASHGYGQTWDGITVRLAHRVAWSLHYGQQVPTGMTIDHKCHNRVCCNPDHLRVLPNVINATDNGQGDKTHCPSNHEYSGSNLYIDPKGHRRCRECAKEIRRKRAALKLSSKAIRIE